MKNYTNINNNYGFKVRSRLSLIRGDFFVVDCCRFPKGLANPVANDDFGFFEVPIAAKAWEDTNSEKDNVNFAD